MPGRGRLRWATVAVAAALLASGFALLVIVVHALWPADRAAGDPARGRASGSPPRVAVAPAPEPVSVVPTPGRLLGPDADGRLRVPLGDDGPSRVPASGAPAGWTLRQFAGQATVDLLRTDAGIALRMRSEASSFALLRDVVVDLRLLPVLTWTWKVNRLPARGDIRFAGTDDQAVQVYVVFPRWPSPRTQSDVIGYVWDTSAPAGTRLASPKAGNVRVMVVESGAAGLGTWIEYRRDVLEDYRLLFGREAPPVGGLAVMTDTNDTRGEAEAWIARLAFLPAGAEQSKMPTSVLR